jgi:nucleoside diphosphate kinase
MATELAYALITPYSLIKSRTGGIIGRMLSLTDLELVGARMYAPSDEFIDEYKETLVASSVRDSAKQLFFEYLDMNCRPANRLGKPNRMMLLLFRGENAVANLLEVIGPVTTEARGDTIRGTFGDFIAAPEAGSAPTGGVTQVIHADGGAHYFEPAVLVAPDWECAKAQLALFTDRADSDGGVLEHVIKYPEGAKPETTLVMLKPEHFAARSARPGNIIDMFSKTGLYIVGARVLHMSVDQANEFYGFLREVFVEKLKGLVAKKLRKIIEESGAFEFRVTDEHLSEMTDVLKEANAEREFSSIVEYMTGVSPDQALSAAARARPGRTKCLALLYQGEEAVNMIRARLGATNPELAEAGTVRHDYGADLLRNGAHASDSVESAARERKIVGLAGGEPGEIVPIIKQFLD